MTKTRQKSSKKKPENEDPEAKPEPELGTKSLYAVLGVESEATQAEIKKAYYNLARKLHPDKNPGDEEAKSKFQSLQRIYAVLGDPQKRKLYDQTGSLEDSEELAGEQFESLYKYYRNIYKQLTEEDIVNFEAEYRGSEEEAAEVLKYYSQFKGDMQTVFECVMCSDPERDSHRFLDLIEEAAREHKVKVFRGFVKWSEAVLKRPRPKNPLKPRAKSSKKPKKDGEDDNALIKAIRAKSSFASMAASLEEKYGRQNGAGIAEQGGEPSEEEFAAAAARLQSQKGSEKDGKKAGSKRKLASDAAEPAKKAARKGRSAKS